MNNYKIRSFFLFIVFPYQSCQIKFQSHSCNKSCSCKIPLRYDFKRHNKGFYLYIKITIYNLSPLSQCQFVCLSLISHVVRNTLPLSFLWWKHPPQHTVYIDGPNRKFLNKRGFQEPGYCEHRQEFSFNDFFRHIIAYFHTPNPPASSYYINIRKGNQLESHLLI